MRVKKKLLNSFLGIIISFSLTNILSMEKKLSNCLQVPKAPKIKPIISPINPEVTFQLPDNIINNLSNEEEEKEKEIIMFNNKEVEKYVLNEEERKRKNKIIKKKIKKIKQDIEKKERYLEDFLIKTYLDLQKSQKPKIKNLFAYLNNLLQYATNIQSDYPMQSSMLSSLSFNIDQNLLEIAEATLVKKDAEYKAIKEKVIEQKEEISNLKCERKKYKYPCNLFGYFIYHKHEQTYDEKSENINNS